MGRSPVPSPLVFSLTPPSPETPRQAYNAAVSDQRLIIGCCKLIRPLQEPPHAGTQGKMLSRALGLT